MTSDEVWESIKPEGEAKGAGLLCGPCICSRLEALGSYGAFSLVHNSLTEVVSDSKSDKLADSIEQQYINELLPRS